ncbi:hypothetical protein Tdes44962_MAKER08973 [Teratosphaeria destructans]|uniref:Uncharacterized protein n=1 Tax=Teratosphaeria destructans TaxID=418781 RepID=A0A9W7W3J1_9PEZI|nr:hypothetical protein Tdes44962_MAKER08973 [Teratosphaeria destructans]
MSTTTTTTTSPTVVYVSDLPAGTVFENLTPELAKADKKICWTPATQSKILRSCSRHMLSKHSLDPVALTAVMEEIGFVTGKDVDLFGALAKKLLSWILANVNDEKLPNALKAQNLTPDATRCRTFEITWAGHTREWFVEGAVTVGKKQHGPVGGADPDFASSLARSITRPWLSEAACLQAAVEMKKSSASAGATKPAFVEPSDVPATTKPPALLATTKPPALPATAIPATTPAPTIVEKLPPSIDAYFSDLASTIFINGYPAKKSDLLARLDHAEGRKMLISLVKSGLDSPLSNAAIVGRDRTISAQDEQIRSLRGELGRLLCSRQTLEQLESEKAALVKDKEELMRQVREMTEKAKKKEEAEKMRLMSPPSSPKRQEATWRPEVFPPGLSGLTSPAFADRWTAGYGAIQTPAFSSALAATEIKNKKSRHDVSFPAFTSATAAANMNHISPAHHDVYPSASFFPAATANNKTPYQDVYSSAEKQADARKVQEEAAVGVSAAEKEAIDAWFAGAGAGRST